MTRLSLTFKLVSLINHPELQALKKMIKKDSGKVIVISSLAGRVPIAFWGAYCMTKFSLSAAKPTQ